MKKIGRQVCLLATGENNPRNGEGAFIRLTDGRILYGFTEYIGDSWNDHAHARLSGVISADEGETWSPRRVLLECPADAKNIMSLSFLRMKNGDIGMFYIKKEQDGTDKLLLVRSSDEGENWSQPIACTDCLQQQDYYVLNNDRVIMLPTGRILFAAARHSVYPKPGKFLPGEVCFFISDDDGYTWRKTERELRLPFPDPDGLQEPGLFVLPDGKIWCYMRTGLGTQWRSCSEDNGESWCDPYPDRRFTSPRSPMLVKNLGNITAAVFNPIPHYPGRSPAEPWGRTPYTCAVSRDGGITFADADLFALEDDLSNGYCYPALLAGDGYFLCAYYHSMNTGVCLDAAVIKKIRLDEID